MYEDALTSILSEVNHCRGRCRVRCSSTMARRGENKRRAFSMATALDGKTTTFFTRNGNRLVVRDAVLHKHLIRKNTYCNTSPNRKTIYLDVLSTNKEIHSVCAHSLMSRTTNRKIRIELNTSIIQPKDDEWSKSLGKKTLKRTYRFYSGYSIP